MSPNLDPGIVCTVINAMVYRADGVSMDEIVQAFPQPPDPLQVQQWVAELIRVRMITVNKTAQPPRYNATRAGAEFVAQAALLPTRAAGTATPGTRSPAVGSKQPSTPQDSLSNPTTETVAVKQENPASVPGATTSQDGSTPQEQARSTAWSILIDAEVQFMVTHLLPRASVMLRLHWAAERDIPQSDRMAFLRYAMDRIEHLTQGECARLGLLPAQFALWRNEYFGTEQTGEANAPTAGNSTGQSASTTEGEKRADTPAANGPSNGKHPSGASKKRPAQPNSVPPEDQLLAKATDALANTSTPPEAPSDCTSKSRDASPVSPGEASPSAPAFASAKTLASALLATADWLIPGRLDPAVKSTLTVIGVSVIGSLAQLIGILAVTLLCAGWVLVALILRRHPSNAPDASPAGAQGAPAPAPRRRRVLLALLVVLIVTVGGAGSYRHFLGQPSKGTVADYLTQSVAPLPVRMAALGLTFGPSSATGRTLRYTARFETTAPLYRRLDTTEYLRAHAPAELAAIEAASAGAGVSKVDGLRSKAGTADPASNLTPNSLLGDVVLLTTSTAPGASLFAQGDLLVWRANGTWNFKGDRVRLDPAPTGESHPGGTTVFVVDAPADLARLRTLLTDRAAYAARVQAAAGTVAADIARSRDQSLASYGELLRPGTLFAGTASAESGPLRIALEITSSSAQNLTALLRNDGGWADARLFRGTWSLSPDSDTCTLTLRTVRDDAIDAAGPLLDHRFDWGFTLQLHPDGTAIVDRSAPSDPHPPAATITGMLRRVAPADAPALRADFSRSLPPALAATKPGLLYRGTITPRGRSAPEVLMLRFTVQDPDGARVEATLQSPDAAPWVRPFRGAIIDNTYRAGATPIRLQSPDANRVIGAPVGSILGMSTLGTMLSLNLRVDGTRLVGQDDRFSYIFERSERESESERGMVVSGGRMAPGARSATDGATPSSTRLPNSSVSHENSPSSNGTPITPKSHDFGYADPAAIRTTLLLKPNSLPAAAASSPAAAPSSPAAGTPAGSGSDQSAFRTPQSAMDRPLPPFPGFVGAYVLSDEGLWVALPRNNGRIVKSLVQKTSALLGWLNQVESRAAKMPLPEAKDVTGQWMFDGEAPVPVVSADNLVVIYAGALIMSPAMLNKYPELANEPMMEMGPLWTLDSGVRSVPLTSPVKGTYGFGPLRVPATLERLTLTITMLRPAKRLPPRRYAVACGDTAYELELR